MTPRRSRRGRSLRTAAIVLGATYAVVLLAAFVFQRRMVFQGTALAREPRFEAGVGAQVVRFAAPDGPLVSALYVPPPRGAALVMVLHGNAGNVITWSPTLVAWVRRGCGALLLDPRGYGWSGGSPSEEGLLADGGAALRWLAAQGVEPSRVVLHGISLGCGTAIPLAGAHPVRGLILEAPFTRLADVAQSSFPFLPCAILLRDRFDNLDAAAGVACPVLVLHGDADEVVPLEQGRRVAGAFRPAASLAVAEGYHHADLHTWPGYTVALGRFVLGLATVPGG